MPFRDQYQAQVRLLMRLLPIVAREACFALKGGTAINLFVRNLPRLSVDIDLMYLPVHDRPEALAGIDASMKRIKAAALAELPGARVTENIHDGAILRLLVIAEGTQVKIEVSPVLRGVVHEPSTIPVTEVVEEAFGFAETSVVSFEDLFAGKLVAALDRQHPRDLFDVQGLLAHEGLSDDLREAFIVYLLSHNRPMGEVLSGRVKDLANEYPDRQTLANFARPALFFASGFWQRLLILAHEIIGELTDIVGQVNILRKPADGVVGFRQGRAAFEDKVVAKRCAIKGLQCPDDPRVLFQKMNRPLGFLCGDCENFPSIVPRQLQKLFSHKRPFLHCGQASWETEGRLQRVRRTLRRKASA